MITQPYHLYVERIAPDKDMARFYALVVQPTLFGEVSLVRALGTDRNPWAADGPPV